MEKLEHAVLDLGAEVYTLKDQLNEMQKENRDLKKSMATLSNFLGETGVVDLEELEDCKESDFDLLGFLTDDDEAFEEDTRLLKKVHH